MRRRKQHEYVMTDSRENKPAPAGRESGGALARWRRARHRTLTEIFYFAVVVLGVTGIAITNVSPAASYRFWMFSAGIFAIAAIITASLRARQRSAPLMGLILEQLVHWALTVFSIIILHFMVLSGRLTFEGAGLVMMLVLGQVIALDGYRRTGWRFALLGLAIMLTALLAAWFAAYVWMIAAAGVLLWLLTLMVDIFIIHPRSTGGADETA